ncbi:hypothetical protein ABKV19_026036 [Rosa sericea]
MPLFPPAHAALYFANLNCPLTHRLNTPWSPQHLLSLLVFWHCPPSTYTLSKLHAVLGVPLRFCVENNNPETKLPSLQPPIKDFFKLKPHPWLMARVNRIID